MMPEPKPTVPESKLTKVKRLLAKAASTDSEHEAERCNAKAAELIAAYGMEEAMLADAEPGRDEPSDRWIDIPGPYAVDKAGLLAGIAGALGCRTVRTTGRQVRVHLIGFAADLDRVSVLFTSLLLQAVRALGHTAVPPGTPAISFRKAFLVAFTTTVIDRLEAAERTAQDQARPAGTGRSVALVLAGRAAAVDAKAAELHPHVRKGRARTVSGSGIAAGQAAGRRASLGGSQLGATTRALPSQAHR